ncbi:hypothetical protein Nepgr_020350 [Nepenthes gracilis]|uniref:Uncharacterized protein n=1 Tax=Nepenthes gracilis TaxID=150966 RepID=A0AAD3XVZ4_NEPGR|nr:hypothetical protein Nepgr_020350 [Nepenthes gracilis]
MGSDEVEAKRLGFGRPAIQKSTRPISDIEHVVSEAKNKVPEARPLPADSVGESLSQVISPTLPSLIQDEAERLGLDGIHSKTGSVPDSHVELCDAPVIDAGNKFLLPLDPKELTQDSSVASVEDQLVNSTKPSIEKAEGSASNSSKTECMLLQGVYVRAQLEGSPGEAHHAEASSNYVFDVSTPWINKEDLPFCCGSNVVMGLFIALRLVAEIRAI